MCTTHFNNLGPTIFNFDISNLVLNLHHTLPHSQEDGWDTDPFVLTEIKGKMYGRGSTDDKGPVLAWLNVIEAYRALGQDIPINIKVRVRQVN